MAYSGEIDKQKQAADMMAKALKEEGMELEHIIGPKTAHAYEPRAKEEVNRRIDSIVANGRDPVPRKVRFTTWTLRYNEMFWVTIDGLNQHWKRARVDAEISDNDTVRATTENVAALTLSMEPGLCPFDVARRPVVVIDGEQIEAAPVMSDRSWTAHFQRADGKWRAGETGQDRLTKHHGLQGPIDDAFMDSFIMVRPTGSAMNEKVGAWVTKEMEHAVDHWRRQFRGEAPVKNDSEISDTDIANNNLILWGDPKSNQLLARIADKLAIRWDQSAIYADGRRFDVDHHVPVLVYPNPLNPKRYVVLNSGFTFREYDYLNNARQIAKLPDWAIIDINVPVSARAPGGVVNAGFFGERWELKQETR